MRDRRPAQLDMRVAPGRQGRLVAEIFDTDVMSADEGTLAVDHDDLAVIAEIELETVDEFARRECVDLDLALAQRIHIVARQVGRADAVIEEVDPDAGRRAGEQFVAQGTAERVVAHDEELDDDVVPRMVDRIEDRVEGRGAVDEQAQMIAGDETAYRPGRSARGLCERRAGMPHAAVARVVLEMRVARRGAHALVAEPACIDIAEKWLDPRNR